MDEHIRRGLLGELLFLEKYMEDCGSEIHAIRGWSGPESADQDFIYSEGWYEIKTIGVATLNVTISSLEQLDCNETGELVIVRVDKTTPDRVNAFSLNDIVYRIKRKLSFHAEALELFQRKLISYGYIDLNEYSATKYYLSGMQNYTVDESFPKLTKNNIPNEIASLSYALNLPSLTKWMKE